MKKIFWKAVFEHDEPFEFNFKRSRYTYVGKVLNPLNRHTMVLCYKHAATTPTVFDMDVMSEGHQYIDIQ